MASSGRPATKKQSIVEELRGRIVSGDLLPGARLPTRRELSEQFGGTLTTIQQAMNSLEQDGVVVSRGHKGTFVADQPPHLAQFALVFAGRPGDPGWRLYWDHLAQVGQQVIQQQGVRLSVYTGVDREHPGPDFERLLDDVRNDRIAGIVFANSPFPVAGTEILTKVGIPRVALCEAAPERRHMGHMVMDSEGFNQRAAAYLAAQNVKSAMVLGQPANRIEELAESLDAVGIICPYHFRHALTLDASCWGRNLTRLMFDHAHTARPEALIVLDDNLFESALTGILDVGLRIPHEVEIVTHSNFPWPVTCPVPVTRLGYDMHQLLQSALAELESQRIGNQSRTLRLTPVFENELQISDQYQIRNGTTHYMPVT